MVYRLLYDLPGGYDYRVVFTLRALPEVIASQEKMLQRLGSGGGDVPSAKLEEIYSREIDGVRQWLDEQPNIQVMYVQYNDVLSNPRDVAERLNNFLGGTLNVDAMERVPDQSLYRNRS
jgi:predicted ABC-type ATPase